MNQVQHQAENATAPPEPDDPRVIQALDAYLGALEEGCKLDRDTFLAEHADIAEALAKCLDGLEFVQKLAPELSQSSAAQVADLAAAAAEIKPEGPLGDFRIVREIGRGGMGVVYEAVQISLGRRVALKVLPFAAAMDPRQLQRFKNEAQAAAHLHHTNIVPVISVGCERGVHYYAMQFIDGQPLDRVIQNRRRQQGVQSQTAQPESANPPTIAYAPAPPASASASADTAEPVQAALSTEQSITSREFFQSVARLGIQAAEGLDYAHQQGILHRDIKPANLLLDVRGNLWITDFGLARFQNDTRLSMTGDLVGTLRYMSPEQALAKRVVVDHRTDIYSLGVTLYELLTLESAFSGGDREELLWQVAFEEPRAPRRLNKSIPAELETIVLKGMEKNPADRYATAQELADDLRRFLEDKTIRAKRPTLVQRARKWGRRHRAVVVATAVVLALALVLLGATGGWLMQRRLAAEATARQALTQAQDWQKQQRWPEAQAAARQAEGLLTGAGGRMELRQRVRELLEDLQMVEELEKIRLDQSQGTSVFGGGTGLNISGADAAYAQFFRDHGVDVEALGLEAAAWIHTRSIAEQLAAALDNWAMARKQVKGKDDGSWKQLLAIARAADTDERRTQVRQALDREDRTALEELVHAAGADLSPTTLSSVAGALRRLGASAPALALLREGQRRYPGDFWLNFNLAGFLLTAEPPQLQEALRFYSVALALRSQNPLMYYDVGLTLHRQGRPDEAMAAYRKAIELKQDSAEAYVNLGSILENQGRLDEALPVFRKAVELAPAWNASVCNLYLVLRKQGRLHEYLPFFRNVVARSPDAADAHFGLGRACMTQGQWGEAVAAFRKTIELMPDYMGAYGCLVTSLWHIGRRDEAVAICRKVIELQPEDAVGYFNLGFALWRNEQRDEAMAAYREAIKRKPDFALAYRYLGDALRYLGQFEEALAACRKAVELEPDADAQCSLAGALEAQEQFEQALVHRRRGHELGSRNPDWAYPSAYWIWRCEGLLKLGRKLPALLQGEAQPADATERLLLASACATQLRYAAATRHAVEAFAAAPRLAEAPFPGARFDAACGAVLAGCRHGKDAADLRDEECAQLRSQALSWLRADLAAWRDHWEKEPDKMRPTILGAMQHWLGNVDFEAIRSPEDLAHLPEAERRRWQQFWGDVQRLLDQAQAPPPTAPQQKPKWPSEAEKKPSSAGR